MGKINNSNFETIEEVIKTIHFDSALKKSMILKEFNCLWAEIVDNRLLEVSKVTNIQKDNTLQVTCADSYIANELYIRKDVILKKITDKSLTDIKDITFNYKKWNNNE